MKKISYYLFILTLLLLASCTNATDTAPSPSPIPDEAPLDTAEPVPTATPSVSSPSPEPQETTGYPPPAEAPPDQSGYPVPPTLVPTRDPYPGGVVWILRPVGEQCSDSRSFADLASAVASLEEGGIPVIEAEEIELLVCQACACPTSEHYRLQIDPANLNRALSLGWRRE